jgi:hypothetical protein
MTEQMNKVTPEDGEGARRSSTDQMEHAFRHAPKKKEAKQNNRCIQALRVFIFAVVLAGVLAYYSRVLASSRSINGGAINAEVVDTDIVLGLDLCKEGTEGIEYQDTALNKPWGEAIKDLLKKQGSAGIVFKSPITALPDVKYTQLPIYLFLPPQVLSCFTLGLLRPVVFSIKTTIKDEHNCSSGDYTNAIGNKAQSIFKHLNPRNVGVVYTDLNQRSDLHFRVFRNTTAGMMLANSTLAGCCPEHQQSYMELLAVNLLSALLLFLYAMYFGVYVMLGKELDENMSEWADESFQKVKDSGRFGASPLEPGELVWSRSNTKKGEHKKGEHEALMLYAVVQRQRWRLFDICDNADKYECRRLAADRLSLKHGIYNHKASALVLNQHKSFRWKTQDKVHLRTLALPEQRHETSLIPRSQLLHFFMSGEKVQHQQFFAVDAVTGRACLVLSSDMFTLQHPSKLIPTRTAYPRPAAKKLAIKQLEPLLMKELPVLGLEELKAWSDVAPLLEAVDSIEELQAAAEDPERFLQRLAKSSGRGAAAPQDTDPTGWDEFGRVLTSHKKYCAERKKETYNVFLLPQGWEIAQLDSEDDIDDNDNEVERVVGKKDPDVSLEEGGGNHLHLPPIASAAMNMALAGKNSVKRLGEQLTSPKLKWVSALVSGEHNDDEVTQLQSDMPKEFVVKLQLPGVPPIEQIFVRAQRHLLKVNRTKPEPMLGLLYIVDNISGDPHTNTFEPGSASISALLAALLVSAPAGIITAFARFIASSQIRGAIMALMWTSYVLNCFSAGGYYMWVEFHDLREIHYAAYGLLLFQYMLALFVITNTLLWLMASVIVSASARVAVIYIFVVITYTYYTYSSLEKLRAEVADSYSQLRGNASEISEISSSKLSKLKEFGLSPAQIWAACIAGVLLLSLMFAWSTLVVEAFNSSGEGGVMGVVIPLIGFATSSAQQRNRASALGTESMSGRFERAKKSSSKYSAHKAWLTDVQTKIQKSGSADSAAVQKSGSVPLGGQGQKKKK